jgi:hypothetical protein
MQFAWHACLDLLLLFTLSRFANGNAFNLRPQHRTAVCAESFGGVYFE